MLALHKPKNRLLVLTSEFPYKSISETFFRDEAAVLAEDFELVFAPSAYPGNSTLNQNFTVLRSETNGFPKKLWQGLRGFPWRAAWFELRVTPRRALTPTGFTKLIIEGLQVGVRFHRLKKISSIALIYSFWGRTDAVAASILGKHFGVNFAYRNHGFDLYEHRADGYIPFKRYLSAQDGLGVYLSESSELYSHQTFGLSNSLVLPLGARIPKPTGMQLKLRKDYFLSLSHISHIKRIGFLAKTLTAVARLRQHKIVWTHVGGSEEQFSECLPRSVSENYLQINHVETLDPDAVEDFLSSSEHGILINTSASEGMPISILEGMARKKAIIAPDVGDIRSAVGSGDNLIFDLSVSPELLASQISAWMDTVEIEVTGESNASRVAEFFDSRACAKRLSSVLMDMTKENDEI